MTPSSDENPCTDVVVANDAQLQQLLSQEVATRKTEQHRANCLHQLLTELRDRKVFYDLCCTTYFFFSIKFA